MHSTTLHQSPISTPSTARPRTPSPFRCPIALSSYHPNPTHDSSAPRRRWDAGGATEQLPGSAAGSLARCQVASPPNRRGGRAPMSVAYSNTVRCPSGVVVPGCPDAHRALLACPRPPSVSARPCPASGMCPASAPPVSARPVSNVRCLPVRCPMSGVCPSGVRCERPASVSVSTLSAPVNSWRAGQPHGSGQAGSACHPPCPRPARRLPEPGLALGAGTGQRRHAAGVRPTTAWSRVVARPRGGGPWPNSAERARPHRGPRQQAVPSKAVRPGGKPGLTWENEVWAWLDLNLGPHPYQRSTAERRANRPFRWSCDSVSPTRMG
jgi:hypothetical protein